MLAIASSAPQSAERLSARRRRSRRRARILLVLLVLILLGALLWGFRQPAVRIARVDVVAGNPSLASYATSTMSGFYLFGLVPRDSFFFVPEDTMRHAILADHPDIAAVSISRESLTALSIRAIARTAVARWCGSAPPANMASSTSGTENCTVFDPNGFLFEPFSSTTPTLNPFAFYEPLAASSTDALGRTLPSADQLPSAFDFARRVAVFGSPVVRVVVRGGEVDDYLGSGTRVTYVLGDEQNAITALVSASAGLNLADGSLEYVDLRFDGKVYLKKVEPRK